MAKEYRPLPIGAENFKRMVQDGYYYVDKTLLIRDLLDTKAFVTLFIRPRRFGKTLNMSMLKYFFEDTGNEALNAENRALFEGLKIMDAGEEYAKQMQRYPVISLTLKSAKQENFSMAYDMLVKEIAREFHRHEFVLNSDRLSEAEKKLFGQIKDWEAKTSHYADALQFLSDCLYKVTGKKSIVLIDEYDVPLENSHFRGFYDQMISFIRSLFESALKTNDNLHFAVITGCLRISKESIFTGLNNFRVVSILNETYGEYFGFTPKEVETMAAYYGMEDRMDDIRDWYDGYLFGNSEVYNPWSVVNFMSDLRANKNAFVRPYWANTSSNEIVRDLIRRADGTAREELEDLLAGGTIEKPIHEDITYEEVRSAENGKRTDEEDSRMGFSPQTLQNNLWNFLFFTGYLKKVSERMGEKQKGEDPDRIYMKLTLPNREVRSIYRDHIMNWFDEQISGRGLDSLYEATKNGDTDAMEDELCEILLGTISYFDSPEAYYHGFMAGVYQQMKNYRVLSNMEVGTGRPDLALVPPRMRGIYFIFEFKIAKELTELEKRCEEALRQIHDQRYVEGAHARGYKNVQAYGIAFCGKECIVQKYEKPEE